MSDDIHRVEHRVQRIESRQDRHEAMLSDTIERVRELSITLARQDERLLSIDKTVTSIWTVQNSVQERDRKEREQDLRQQETRAYKQREFEAKLAQQRLLWAAGAILALGLLIANLIVGVF